MNGHYGILSSKPEHLLQICIKIDLKYHICAKHVLAIIAVKYYKVNFFSFMKVLLDFFASTKPLGYKNAKFKQG